MSSLKKHFPHFGSHLHTNHCNQDGKCVPHNANSRPVTGHSRRSVATTSTSPVSDSHLNNEMVSFKADVLSCLDQCSSYIQALNNLCSAGAVLAQNLTQVFSRDVVCSAPGLLPLPPAAAKSDTRRRLLGLRAGHRRQSEAASDPSPDSDSDSLYYDMTEQFLRVWEMMSVSTAGASATIKTETLMTLQEVMNQLESADNPHSGDSDQDLGQSIESAKSCLLAYIELQAQFSHSSWKSLNHLSKALKSDSSMTDVVKNIKQHFDFSAKSAACSTSRSEDRGQDPGPPDLHNKTSSQNVSGLGEAVELLSLETGSRRSRKRHRIKSSSRTTERRHNNNNNNNSSTACANDKSSFEKENIFTSTVAKSSATRLSHLGDKCFSSSQVGTADPSGMGTAIKSQSTSTWPGKVVASTNSAIETTNDKFQESWSLWSSHSPALAESCSSSPWRTPYWTMDPTPGIHAQSASNLRTVTATLSASTISGSGASSSNNSIGVPSSASSHTTNRSYDLFAPIHKNPVSYLNGTQSLKAHVSTILTNNLNNNNSHLSFGGFASVTDILNLERMTSPVSAVTRYGSGDNDFSPAVLPHLSSNRHLRSPLLSPDCDPLLMSPVNASLQFDPNRLKTSTWPLKQEPLSGCQHVSDCPSSALTNNANWQALCSVPSDFPLTTEPLFDNDLRQRRDGSKSLWSFDVPEKGDMGPNQIHRQQVLPVGKSDLTRFTLFETNNNCGLSDKNF